MCIVGLQNSGRVTDVERQRRCIDSILAGRRNLISQLSNGSGGCMAASLDRSGELQGSDVEAPHWLAGATGTPSWKLTG
jgi:hypothetical protein